MRNSECVIDPGATSAAGACATRPADDQGLPGTGCSIDDRAIYCRLLEWTFNLFSSTRLLTYIPTLWSICASADSSQHSLWTWGAWIGSNASMAAWLYEKNGRRFDKAVVVMVGNCLMCAAACVLILFYRR